MPISDIYTSLHTINQATSQSVILTTPTLNSCVQAHFLIKGTAHKSLLGGGGGWVGVGGRCKGRWFWVSHQLIQGWYETQYPLVKYGSSLPPQEFSQYALKCFLVFNQTFKYIEYFYFSLNFIQIWVSPLHVLNKSEYRPPPFQNHPPSSSNDLWVILSGNTNTYLSH